MRATAKQLNKKPVAKTTYKNEKIRMLSRCVKRMRASVCVCVFVRFGQI